MDNFKIRFANVEDASLILNFIQQLAEYVGKPDEVVATEELLTEWIFEKEKAEVLIGELDGKPVAFSVFFYSFSTFLGRAGIYLEDLFVLPEMRGMGIGKKMLKHLAKITIERGCGRLEWWCLDWNKNSINFYLSLGAKAMNDGATYRITGDTLTDLAK